jgi:hypothetical protein
VAAVKFLRVWKRKPRTLVLGQQLADARKAENERVASEPTFPSPMPKETYPTNESVRASLDPKPLPLDFELKELCRRAAALDADAHRKLRRAISMDEFYTLLAFSRRMALLAVRAKSPEGLREAVEAVALIEIARVDFRDVMVALGVLAYACNRIGQSHRSFFEDASKRADPQVAQLLRERGRQSLARKKLSDLSFFEEVSTKYGPGFVSHGGDAYSPTVDLVAIAVEIAELLEADKYGPVGIQIAITLPPVWLRSAGEAAVRSALSGAPAGASVSGFLRAEVRPQEEGHSVLVFLVECADEARASKLEGLARNANHTSHAVIGCAEGRLFCIVVGHSMMHGVSPIETASTLSRFASGISAAMRRALAR